MDLLATIIQHGVWRQPPPLWAVVVVAAGLAWLDHRTKSRGMRSYDAWWLFNLRGVDKKLFRRSRRP